TAVGEPITATSANRAGEPPACDVAAARVALGAAVDCYLDGGTVAGGLGSTVLLVDDEGARLVRAGAVPVEGLRSVLGTFPLATWRRAGVLRADGRQALYLYAQRFVDADGAARERVGIIGALRLESFESGKVRPHERTLERAKSDRLALLRATGASLSPIFGL